MLNTLGLHESHDWTSSTGHSLLSKSCNWCENMSGCIPLVTLQCLAGKSHCLLSTWLESSSEVWSSTIWRKEEDWGPLSRGTRLFFANPSFLHLPALRDSIKVDTFLLCLRRCDGCQDLQGLIGEERGNLWMCVGRMQWEKPIGAPFTWEDTHRLQWEMFWLSCLQSWRWREERKKAKGKKK